MPRRFVRDSKFRHVFGEAYKKTKCYDNIDISKNTWDGGNYCAVNSKFVAIVLERCCFIVLPVEKIGRIEPNFPKIHGHKGNILDLQFNPFNTNIIASAGEDARIKIWSIPDCGLKEDLNESVIDLIGHSKKVGIVQWHPTANSILASGGFDSRLIIWNVENGSPVHVLDCHRDIINSLCWNKNGSLIATTCKDKMARIIDPRKHEALLEFKAHSGSKPSRVHFVDEARVITIGCQSNAQREITLWNINDQTKPITTHEMDSGSGNLLTMYDEILNILYVAAKGDCNIRYFEISKESPYIHYLSQYTSAIPQRGFGVLPKCALNVNKCEIFRLYKLSSNGLCEPISMVVPRKSYQFQPDIYPDVPGDIPGLTAEEWFCGDNINPNTISLKDGFIPTKKEFTVTNQETEENIFSIHMQTAPKREEDLRKAFYQQQDELHKLRELLKNKELKIRQLEYENQQLKKEKTKSKDITELKKDMMLCNTINSDKMVEIKTKTLLDKITTDDYYITAPNTTVNQNQRLNTEEPDEVIQFKNNVNEKNLDCKKPSTRSIPEIIIQEYLKNEISYS